MEPAKIADGVREVIDFMKIDKNTMAEKIVILRSAADLLNQIILAEAYAASLITSFRNAHNKE